MSEKGMKEIETLYYMNTEQIINKFIETYKLNAMINTNYYDTYHRNLW